MWMVDPRIMCRQHLLGEHLETHMFLSVIKKGCISLGGYIRHNLLEVCSLKTRHDALAAEMMRRGYNHQTLMEECDVSNAMVQNIKIDIEKSQEELLRRCRRCLERYDMLQKGESV